MERKVLNVKKNKWFGTIYRNVETRTTQVLFSIDVKFLR